jgi:ribosomal protein S18 acetylase RimI-like enzyme
MAARSEAPLPEIVELTSLTVAELSPLMEEEISEWRRYFSWDFRPSADLLRRFVGLRSLVGYALCVGRTVVGYSYHVCEGNKGLIGDFYLRRDYADPSNEMMLLGATVQGLMLAPGVKRIESQLLLLNAPPTQTLPFNRFLSRYERYFMEVSRAAVLALRPRVLPTGFTVLPWSDGLREEAAHLMTTSYFGHVDSEINDQYRTVPGARHFLTNIIQFPGCGHFSSKGSIVAVDRKTGRICGMSLVSMVSESSGHVTQLCVSQDTRGTGLGYELMRQSMVRLLEFGCKTISLTVTVSNVEALRLYESIGFTVTALFPALVWEGFGR